MNAHSKAYLYETPLATKVLLTSVMKQYGHDSADRQFAIKAIAEDRAAFWRTTDGQNQVGSLLTAEANLGGDIVGFCKDRQIGRPTGFILRHGLDVLVPLNRKATMKLAAAYEAFGTFRSEVELDARRVPTARFERSMSTHTSFERHAT